MGQGLRQQELQRAAHSVLRFGRLAQALQQFAGLPVLTGRHEDPRQREMLELAQVTELVISPSGRVTRPCLRFAQMPLPEIHLRFQRLDGAQIGHGIFGVHPFCFIQQFERGVKVPLGSLSRAPAPRASDTANRPGSCAGPALRLCCQCRMKPSASSIS